MDGASTALSDLLSAAGMAGAAGTALGDQGRGAAGVAARDRGALLHRRRLCPSSETLGMRTRRPRPAPAIRSAFAGFRFPPDVIVLAVRWYLRFGLSYPRRRRTARRT